MTRGLEKFFEEKRDSEQKEGKKGIGWIILKLLRNFEGCHFRQLQYIGSKTDDIIAIQRDWQKKAV